MASRYLDDDGAPRYGARVSPEELEAIRREQGIEPPPPAWPDDGSPALDQPRWSQGWGPDDDPYAPGRGGDGAPRVPASPDARQARRGASPRVPAAQERAARARRSSVRTLVVGLLVMVLAPLGLLTAAVALVVDGGIGAGRVLSESGEVYLEAEQSVGLYASDVAVGALSCSVTDPQGASVPVQGVAGAQVPYAGFTSVGEGTYTVSCEGGTAGVVVGPAMRTERALPASMLVLTGVAGGLAGLVLAAVATVRLVRSR